MPMPRRLRLGSRRKLDRQFAIAFAREVGGTPRQMLRDLLDLDEPRRILQADVLVIGGGIAGLLLATRLVRHGARTILVESGGVWGTSAPHPLNSVTQVGQSYRGAVEGRYRGLGGTSLRWGGAMLPFLACDLGPHTAGWPIEWPVSLEVIGKFFSELEYFFALPGGPFEVESDRTLGAAEPPFIVRSAKYPVFRIRNIAQILHNEIHGPKLEVWINATASRFRLQESGRIASVVAVSPSGKELSIDAQIVVVAAGAIESTRLLLLLDAQHRNRVFHPQGQLGRYFFDHLSAPAATVDPIDRLVLNMAFGTRLESRGMRDIRIEPGPSLRNASRLPGAFAHLAAKSAKENGFTALRAIYRDLQSRSPLNWRNLATLGRDMPWLLEASWWRWAKRRLLAPRESTFELMLVVEQMPHAENTITLDNHRYDQLGSPLAQINWRVHEHDFASFRAVQSALAVYWRETSLAALGSLRTTPESTWRQHLLEVPDIYHPGGTTRMGRDKRTSVVNADLKTFQIDNLFVVSTSAFPSGGCANPTFMLMAFALRAAGRIAKELRGIGVIPAPDEEWRERSRTSDQLFG